MTSDQLIDEKSLIDAVMIGGNHLAGALLDVCDPCAIKSYDQALQELPDPYVDIWAAWRAIMNLAEYRNANP